MTLPSESRLTRTVGSTGTANARTRYATARSTTVLAVRGDRAWRRARTAVISAWRGVSDTVTPAGWLLLTAAAAGIGLGLAFGWVEFTVAGAIATALLLLSVPFLFSARAYDVDLTLGHDRVVAGAQVQGTLRVTNIGRGIALPGRIDVPVGEGLVDVYVPILRHGHEHVQQVVVPAERRGVITVGPAHTVRGDPLGILKREATWDDTHTLYIHPVTTALHSTSTGFIRDLEGQASRMIVDADISFHALREYVPGDSPRQIHWKSTAKTGTLMVRQYEETRRSRMIVALALGEGEYGTDDEFELAVSAAASIGIRGIRDGRDVDVVVGGEVPEFARRTVRTIRELATVSTRTLLDELSGVQRTTLVGPLADVTSLARETHGDASIAFLVCGSTQTPRLLQAAALAFPSDVAVVAVVCNPEAEPGFRRLGTVTVLTIGLLDDLRHMLARGAQT
ncbi:DUF58 domain-containing protein [Microbacterium sp. zg-Y818]|uniref:DUF58 domain-containing protein n=1 Tax=unclassified Microbacterium TaxID=2609290 RepID=UPI00214C319B|nr:MULTISPECIES: DUF58 domain-containing protein [unclassified Microbacterium]MCR2801430.1 DUF58 domain-containing protein [Microbacterium sp. zg.Y818]WIM21250.1 DUF58 domain-containing protein [Microbacterium sp. zg-Y818]